MRAHARGRQGAKQERKQPKANPNLRCELWHSDSDGCHTFFPADQQPIDLPGDARSIGIGMGLFCVDLWSRERERTNL